MNRPLNDELHKAEMTRLLNHKLFKTELLKLLRANVTKLAIKINELLKLHKATVDGLISRSPSSRPRTRPPRWMSGVTSILKLITARMVRLDQHTFFELTKTELLKDGPLHTKTEAGLSALFKDKWLDLHNGQLPGVSKRDDLPKNKLLKWPKIKANEFAKTLVAKLSEPH